MRRIGAVLLFIVVALGGCIGGTPRDAGGSLDDGSAQAFLEDAVFDTSDKWSHTLENGTYAIGEPVEHFVTSEAGDEISIGIVKPKDLGPNETVPVVADAGPYYGELEGPVTNPDDARLDNFLIENLVPHGYAVAMVSVPGTGNSGGCEDYFGPREQAALDAAVEYLAKQDWSNGNVGLIGKSYDGSTPWEAASTPAANEHLKTIVPMAGIPSFRELHFMNGTAEFRAPFLNLGYWSFGLLQGGIFAPYYRPQSPSTWADQPDPVWAERACPAVAEHAAFGATGTATGGGPDASGYWETRSFKPEVLENYDGSVFIVHGLQDWNVHPDMVTHIWDDLDNEKKLWFGQWRHIYPDRPEEIKRCEEETGLCPYPEAVRWDFAEVLKRWFDRELKGMDVETGPTVWSQDNRGGWHASEDWPPSEHTERHQLYLGAGTLSHDKTDHGVARLFAPGGTSTVHAGPAGSYDIRGAELSWTSEAFEKRTRITGEPRFHFTITPTTADGNLHANLYDVGPDGERTRIGRAYMNIKYAAGGEEMQPVTPGQDLEVRMQLFPLDVVIPEGHKLELTLTQDSAYWKGAGPMLVHWGEGYDSTLSYLDVHEYQTGLPWRGNASS